MEIPIKIKEKRKKYIQLITDPNNPLKVVPKPTSQLIPPPSTLKRKDIEAALNEVLQGYKRDIEEGKKRIRQKLGL